MLFFLDCIARGNDWLSQSWGNDRAVCDADLLLPWQISSLFFTLRRRRLTSIFLYFFFCYTRISSILKWLIWVLTLIDLISLLLLYLGILLWRLSRMFFFLLMIFIFIEMLVFHLVFLFIIAIFFRLEDWSGRHRLQKHRLLRCLVVLHCRRCRLRCFFLHLTTLNLLLKLGLLTFCELRESHRVCTGLRCGALICCFID